MTLKKDAWGSRIGLILAMAGNSVGLGNFLRFPVQAVQNGGGTFIIPYLVCFVLMGIPLLWIEWSMGRFGGSKGHHSTPFIFNSLSSGSLWKYIGVFGIFTNLAVAAYYCYIESWTLSYAFHSISGTFSGLSQSEVAQYFNEYIGMSTSFLGMNEAIFFFFICIALNTFILSKGLVGVEQVAKIGMPLLILFGLFLAFKGLTLGNSAVSEEFPLANAWSGLNFLWTPEYDSLLRPGVWLAAAGQIFFTLSVGMGTIHCYAAYVDSKDDVALNAVSAGFTNEFVEVVLGSLIVIPIAAGYFGLDWVKENISFGVAFQSMPYLFAQWGDVLSSLAGVLWFGLLFFAGITSSLAMGTPWVSFMRDEFGWGKVKGAVTFGFLTLALGLPCVLFYQYGFFDQYDYWAGTVSLVIFALAETILFAWVFGMNKGWKEINSGAEITIPYIFRYIIKYVTPTLLTLVFFGALFTPLENNWISAFQELSQGNGWSLDNASLIRQLMNTELNQQLSITTDQLVKENLMNKIFYSNAARIVLALLFSGIATLVYFAYKKRLKAKSI
jgi:SNF family Na+-dependent transporter